ncbi:MAG: ferritin family protein [bacterium]|nr:ferritin family protein [bacterium]
MFTKSEIINIAIAIEESGFEFYKEAENIVPKDLKEVFHFLSKEELKHKETFEEILRGLKGSREIRINDEDYEDYVKAIGQIAVFKKNKLQEKIRTLDTPEKIIIFAIEMETTSINYYNFLLEVETEKNRSLLNQILAEERKHLATLTNILDKLKK